MRFHIVSRLVPMEMRKCTLVRDMCTLLENATDWNVVRNKGAAKHRVSSHNPLSPQTPWNRYRYPVTWNSVWAVFHGIGGRLPAVLCLIFLSIGSSVYAQSGTAQNGTVGARVGKNEWMVQESETAVPETGASETAESAATQPPAQKVTSASAEDAAFRERVEAFMVTHETADATNAEKAAKEIQQAKKKAQRPTANLEGRIFTDIGTFSESAVARQQFPAENALGFRSARMGINGDIYDKWIYRISMEFGRPSDNGVVFAHCYLGVKDTAGFDRIMVGHNKEPLGLDRCSSMQQGLFLENGLQLALMPSWNWGVMGQRAFHDDRMTFAIGGFADRTTESVPTWEGNPSGTAITARWTAVPWYDETTNANFLHLGTGYSFRDINEHRNLSYKTQAESTYSPIVGGGTITGLGTDGTASGIDTRTLFSAELLGNHGPWSIQSEYCVDFLGADTSFNTSVQPNAIRDGHIQAFYLAGSYFLTGEHRTYDRKTGTLGTITPNRCFLAAPDGGKTGWGAWQIAYRFSMIDYGNLYRQGHQDTPVAAYRKILGEQVIDHTIGLNWYWNPYARTMFDYIYTQSDANSPNGTSRDGTLQTLAMRMQVNW